MFVALAAISACLAGAAQPALAADAGEFDQTWGDGGKADLGIPGEDIATGIAVYRGKTVVAATSNDGSAGGGRFTATRLDANGTLDDTFSGDGRYRFRFIPSGGSGPIDAGVEDVAIQPDGRVVLSGWTKKPDGRIEMAVARLTADGKLDKTFDKDGGRVINLLDSSASRVRILSTGKILLAGPMRGEAGVIRLQSDGSTDTKTFGDNGIVRAAELDGGGFPQLTVGGMTIQRNGKIVVVGTTTSSVDGGLDDLGVIRLNSDGTPDTGFDGDGVTTVGLGGAERAAGVGVQSDGTIVVGGWTTYAPPDYYDDEAVVGLTKTGAIDSSFGEIPGVTYVSYAGDVYAQDLAIDSSNRIILGAMSEDPTEAIVTRFAANGEVDQSFGNGGKFLGESQLQAVGLWHDHPLGAYYSREKAGPNQYQSGVARLIPEFIATPDR